MNNPSDRMLALKQFDPGNSTWVVADLRLKLEIQQFILKQQGYFEDHTILRVSELWKNLLKRLQPEFHIRSVESIKIILSEWLEKEDLSFKENVDSTVMQMMDLMHPLFVHQQQSAVGSEQMRAWLYENIDSLQRWGGWYLLAEKYFQQFLQHKMISPRWMPGFLQSQINLGSAWNRSLIFDLGSQLTQTEADLILMLSRFLDVQVLAPRLDLSHRFEYLLKPYAFLRDQSFSQKKLSDQGSSTPVLTTVQEHSGVLAECKSAVVRIRQWFESGIDFQQMAIVAPDIEQYWPLLQPLLNTEGVPVNKATVFKLQQLPSMQQWLSQLKIRNRRFDYSDLENAQYLSVDDNPQLRFEKFYALFSQMLDADDLVRHDKIKKAFVSDSIPQGLITVDEAMGWTVKFWPAKQPTEFLEPVFRELLTHADRDLRLKLSSWVQWVQIIAAKKEMTLLPAVSSGVQIANLEAADSVYVTHRIFLGNSVGQMNRRSPSILTAKEIASIASQLGFYLEHPDISNSEFDLTWLSQWQAHQDIENVQSGEMSFYFAHTGFSGEAESPVQKWAELAAVRGKTHAESSVASVWDDDLQSAVENGQLLEQNDNHTMNIQYISERKFSPSALESYRECPFIFASQRIFKLEDHPVIDLDVDRRTTGTLMHALFEKIMQAQAANQQRRFDWTESELRLLIDDLRKPLQLDHIDHFIWQGIREKYVKMAVRVLSFEKLWHEQYPHNQIWAAEKNFEVEMHNIPLLPEADRVASPIAEPSSQPPWILRGKIDRIDWNQKNQFVVLDYKTSMAGMSNYGSWIKKNELQLALYIFAAEQFLQESMTDAQVVGAFYYFVKELRRDYGLGVQLPLPFFEASKNAVISEPEKSELMKEISFLVSKLVTKIIDGQFSPEPFDVKDCDSCQWRKLCRAPHMNW